jgi:hypothetical protein
MRRRNLFNELNKIEILEWRSAPSAAMVGPVVSVDDDGPPEPEPAPPPDPGPNDPIIYPVIPPSGPAGPGK